MQFPSWLKGGLVGVIYVLTFFLLKAICVPEWCFADIFLPVILWPLSLLRYFTTDQYMDLIGNNLLIVSLILWFSIGAIVGLIYKKAKPDKTNPESCSF